MLFLWHTNLGGEVEPEYVASCEDRGCIPRDVPICHILSAQCGTHGTFQKSEMKCVIVPPHLKNEHNCQVVSSRSGTFLNCVATIDGKHRFTRKRDSSGSLYYKYICSASSNWLLSTQTTSLCNVTLM